MIDALRNFFSSPEAPDSQLPPARSSPLIRAELSVAQDSLATLGMKIETAREELASAQQRYDAGMQSYALGQSSQEPDRGELAASISKLDAFRRIEHELQGEIARLTSELAGAELHEAISEGRESLGPLISVAEAALGQFEQAISMARQAHDALYASLFDEQSGLRQSFGVPELAQEARKARYRINECAQSVARDFQYPIDPRFQTHGEVNLGIDESSYFHLRLGAGIERAVIRSRIERASKSLKEY
jgi:hypothetical protein